jgi:hypothetical protein
VQDIVNLLLNAGTSIVVIAYFMYRDYKFMDTLQTTLQTLVDTVMTLQNSVKFFHGEEVKKND